jgi:PII-like signaling protein
MLTKGPAKKVTIFINEDVSHRMTSLHDALMTYLLQKGVAGATATRALSGFGSHHALHTTRMEATAEHLPIRIEFVETAERVDELLPTLYEMVTDGLIEVQDTTVIKLTRASTEQEPRLPHQRKVGPAKMLRIFLGEADKWRDEPLYDAIVKKLRMLDIAGATVYRGILGYGAKGHEHKKSFLHVSRDLPIMLSVIDSPEKIRAAAEVVEGMLEDGLLVISDVEMVRLIRSLSGAKAHDSQQEAPDADGSTR